jgi:hypothetical protein
MAYTNVCAYNTTLSDYRGRLDVSVHPFTGGSHPTDVRITTRYSSDLWLQGVSGTVHEVGHALYEQVTYYTQDIVHTDMYRNYVFSCFVYELLCIFQPASVSCILTGHK